MRSDDELAAIRAEIEDLLRIERSYWSASDQVRYTDLIRRESEIVLCPAG